MVFLIQMMCHCTDHRCIVCAEFKVWYAQFDIILSAQSLKTLTPATVRGDAASNEHMPYSIFFHRIQRFSCQNVHYTFLEASCDIFLPHFQALLSVIVQGIYYSRFKAAETEVITA